MGAPNVNELNVDKMLTSAETIVGILRVVHDLQEFEDYTKEDAAQDLIEFLNHMGHLESSVIVKKLSGETK